MASMASMTSMSWRCSIATKYHIMTGANMRVTLYRYGDSGRPVAIWCWHISYNYGHGRGHGNYGYINDGNGGHDNGNDVSDNDGNSNNNNVNNVI